MQGMTPPLTEQDQLFYRGTLHKLSQDSPVAAKAGADMMHVLRKEIFRTLSGAEHPEYFRAVGELYKVITDSLVSAVHRSAPHELINRVSSDHHVVTDEEEYNYHHESGMYGDENEDDVDSESNSDLRSSAKGSDPALQKLEELRMKRRAEEEMLLKEKKVLDEKNNAYHTIGPFPPPRLTLRTTATTFPSRKLLRNRTVVETPSSSASDEERDEETAGLATAGSSGRPDAVNHLTAYLTPLSVDSLKKIGESAKAKLRPSSSHDEFVSSIVKTAVRLGCEKASVLMDKQRIIEDLTSHVQAGPLPTTASIDFLNTLPDHLKQSLGGVLGLPEANPPVEEMWERMVAMGFLSVLTNLRLKPLKKIAADLGVTVPDSNSTEKFCEAVVFSAFPRERLRAKASRATQKGVRFTVAPGSMITKGDMGFITFRVENISMLAKESERHYSPEFIYAHLKWSLLCMTNKEALALYLCQTGSVHCKFIITVVNHLNQDDSICNEGTQSFSAMSQENDWGFNNVIKFSDLMNPSQAFRDAATDSITIQVGIVLVQPIKPVAAVREKAPPAKEKKTGPKVDEAVLRQLLADEKAEQARKKVKQEISKTIKEEERTRKEIVQRSTKAYHDLCERLKSETKRIAKELTDRERKEEMERQRETEKLKQAQEQVEQLRARVEAMKKESADLALEKQRLTQEIKDAKRNNEKMAGELRPLTERVQQAVQKAKAQEKKVEAARKRLESLRSEEPATPSVTEEDDDDYDNDFINADLTRLIDQMTVEM